MARDADSGGMHCIGQGRIKTDFALKSSAPHVSALPSQICSRAFLADFLRQYAGVDDLS